MLRILTGIGLILFAIMAVLVFVQGTGSPLARQIVNSLYCQPGEEVAEFGAGHMNFACQDATGRQRNVSQQSVMTGVFAYTVPFILGTLLIVNGSSAIKLKGTQAANVNPE